MSTETPERIPAEAEHATAPLDLDALIRELDVGWDQLPESALRQCQANAELVTPRLIETIVEATRQRRGGKTPDGNAHFFALHLLAEFRAKQALPAVLEMLTLPEDALDDLIGDVLTETMPRILAVLGADHPDLIESMIASRDLFYFVRSAAGTALCAMVGQGTLTREAALGRLLRQLRTAVEAGDKDAATISICNLGDLNPLEAQDEIRIAFERNLVDEEMTDWDGFKEYDLLPDRPGECPHLNSTHFEPIDDTVAELGSWYCFSERPDKENLGRLLLRPLVDDWDESLDAYDDGPDGELDDEVWEMPVREPLGPLTIRNEGHRIGRNDPCPCGSGKKYKKCCMKSGDAQP